MRVRKNSFSSFNIINRELFRFSNMPIHPYTYISDKFILNHMNITSLLVFLSLESRDTFGIGIYILSIINHEHTSKSQWRIQRKILEGAKSLIFKNKKCYIYCKNIKVLGKTTFNKNENDVLG